MLKPKKVRLTDRLINEGWFKSEKEALPWIMAGRVLVDTRRMISGAEMVSTGGVIRVKEYYKTKYVNKGGLKLQWALENFDINVAGAVALDCGASTGGFTDCLLTRGAGMVYAVDAGFNMLAGKLLADGRVVNMERTNISDGSLLSLTPKPELVTLDLSYLSLKTGVAAAAGILRGKGEIVALIKPIVEVRSPEIKRSGDVNRRGILTDVLTELCGFFEQDGYCVAGLTHSPVRGNNGALEYFIHLKIGDATPGASNGLYRPPIERVIDESLKLAKFDKNNVREV